jgi:hypothetical protein
VSRRQIPYLRLSGKSVRFPRSQIEAWLASKESCVVQNGKMVCSVPSLGGMDMNGGENDI